ncbi:hypothetical protein VPH35_002077 [Triticum aestivum]|uniref:Uncharacterized protein n=1 Tax=Triticum urartu TaxID=4572 RepID=A0A8R7P690_TRIUA
MKASASPSRTCTRGASRALVSIGGSRVRRGVGGRRRTTRTRAPTVVLAASRRPRGLEFLVDVLKHWRRRTIQEPGRNRRFHRLHGRPKCLHRQRRDRLLRGRRSVLVVTTRGAIPSFTVAAVASITVATSVETTTGVCTVEAAPVPTSTPET